MDDVFDVDDVVDVNVVVEVVVVGGVDVVVDVGWLEKKKLYFSSGIVGCSGECGCRCRGGSRW